MRKSKDVVFWQGDEIYVSYIRATGGG